MFRYLLIPVVLATIFSFSPILGNPVGAEPLMPQAPADVSWIPHGYGGPMFVDTSLTTVQKGVYGFRDAPKHTATWSQPLWGWDVNGFYAGPNVPCPDPGELQLPIGLIYPSNGPELPPGPPRRSHVIKVVSRPANHPGIRPSGRPPQGQYYGTPAPYSHGNVPSQPGPVAMAMPTAAPQVVWPEQAPVSLPPAPQPMGYSPVAGSAPVPQGYGGNIVAQPYYQ